MNTAIEAIDLHGSRAALNLMASEGNGFTLQKRQWIYIAVEEMNLNASRSKGIYTAVEVSLRSFT